MSNILHAYMIIHNMIIEDVNNLSIELCFDKSPLGFKGNNQWWFYFQQTCSCSMACSITLFIQQVKFLCVMVFGFLVQCLLIFLLCNVFGISRFWKSQMFFGWFLIFFLSFISFKCFSNLDIQKNLTKNLTQTLQWFQILSWYLDVI